MPERPAGLQVMFKFVDEDTKIFVAFFRWCQAQKQCAKNSYGVTSLCEHVLAVVPEHPRLFSK